MKRVAIIGCPGAGKTTFARKLSNRTSLPIIHLDYYYHQKKYDYYNDKEAWTNQVTELITQENWIMDGNYSSTFEVRFKRADTIIFLDYPRWLSMYGVIKRRIQYHNKLRDEMPSDWKEKADAYFLKYVWNFRDESRSKLTAALENTKDKNILVFKNRKESEQYLQNIVS